MDCGVSIEVFWNSSILEVRDLIDSDNRVKNKEFKIQTKRDFINAEVAHRWQSNLYKKEGSEFDSPYVWEYYPDLFEEEKKYSEEQQKEAELEKLKGNRKRYAEEYKRRQGRE